MLLIFSQFTQTYIHGAVEEAWVSNQKTLGSTPTHYNFLQAQLFDKNMLWKNNENG